MRTKRALGMGKGCSPEATSGSQLLSPETTKLGFMDQPFPDPEMEAWKSVLSQRAIKSLYPPAASPFVQRTPISAKRRSSSPHRGWGPYRLPLPSALASGLASHHRPFHSTSQSCLELKKKTVASSPQVLVPGDVLFSRVPGQSEREKGNARGGPYPRDSAALHFL